ncbi:P-loop containing nucleoside triphosphate hydrolase protein, partial [Rhizodiscina lignyota]
AAFEAQLKSTFYGHIATKRFSAIELRNQKDLADLRYPLEWYPATRELQRKIHLHVGPTNSGKTYHALKALEKAATGVYAGPLRLLAHEVYTRMNAKGKNCMLVTGEERRIPDYGDKPNLISCTVEMMDCSNRMDVAVVDEIQMIGDNDRGWAWTQALLGVRAKEVHLCGEERAVPLIKELVALMGDSLEIHRYERLTPLETDPRHLGGRLHKLRKGDCIVSFSILGIHALRKQIEQTTGKNVAIVYGSLPPETRAQQARLFNDPDNNYDFLVASDAIGMGLNLSIKRIIFESSQKNDGSAMKTLTVSQIKQIAGRAGRYRTSLQDNKEAASNLDATPPEVEPKTEIIEPPADNPSTSLRSSDRSTTGLVTTLYAFDYPVITDRLKMEAEPITSAGLFPPSSVVERFSSYFPPGTPFSYILLRLHEISRTSSRFHLCGLRDAILVADLIQKVEGLSTTDRIIFCAAPVSKDPGELLVSLARCVADQKGGSLLDLPPEQLQLELLEQPADGERSSLRRLERLHKDIILYLWLSYRFSGIFSTRQLALYVKGLVEKKIEETIAKMSFNERSRHRMRVQRE